MKKIYGILLLFAVCVVAGKIMLVDAVDQNRNAVTGFYGSYESTSTSTTQSSTSHSENTSSMSTSSELSSTSQKSQQTSMTSAKNAKEFPLAGDTINYLLMIAGIFIVFLVYQFIIKKRKKDKT